jgi:integrase
MRWSAHQQCSPQQHNERTTPAHRASLQPRHINETTWLGASQHDRLGVYIGGVSDNRTLEDAIAEYLDAKNPQLKEPSRRSYSGTLRKLAEDFAGRRLTDFAAPSATSMLKEFLDRRWGPQAESTYNGNLSIVQDFFLWHTREGHLDADRAGVLQRKKEGRKDREALERPLFAEEDRTAILRANPDVRDIVALRLVIDFGVRKGALQKLRFGDFDRSRRQVALTTRGGPIVLPLPDQEFWEDFDQLRGNLDARDECYLLPRRTRRRFRPKQASEIEKLFGDLQHAARRGTELAVELRSTESAVFLVKLDEAIEFFALARERALTKVRIYPTEPSGEHGMHLWWYDCLRRAGLVERGVTRGQAMRKGRHTAGKRVLDRTGGDFKAVAKMLGMGVRTARITYANTPADSLEAAMANVRRQLDDQSTSE